MTALVTGCAGFIGSHLCERLIKDGYDVVGIDNLSLGTMDNIDHLDNLKMYQVDILDDDLLGYVFANNRFDVVFHLAALSDISKGDPKEDFDNTFLATFRLLDRCRAYHVGKFLFTSSGAVYGSRAELMDEDSATEPISHYAASKLASEAFIRSYCSMYGIKAWICRLGSVVGERATHGVINDFIIKLKENPSELRVLGNGNQTKPYIYVKDCVDAMMFIFNKTNESVNLFNISSVGRTSVKHIAEWVVLNMGVHAKITYQNKTQGWDGDVTDYRCNSDKLFSLGWLPKITSTGAVNLAIEKMYEVLR